MGKLSACLVESFCRALQYLQVPCAGGPVHVLPRSAGLSAHAPQILHSHLSFPCSKTCLTVWLAD
eukprot:16448766-Heterocapsa_arctica.AAC.1